MSGHLWCIAVGVLLVTVSLFWFVGALIGDVRDYDDEE